MSDQVNITESQRRNWLKLQALIIRYYNDPAKALRLFAMQILAEQLDPDRIIIAGQVLQQFGTGFEFPSKTAFIVHHGKDQRQGNDAIFLSVSDALGYHAIIELADQAPKLNQKDKLNIYTPLEHKDTNLNIHAIIHKAYKQGTHWNLKNHVTPGDGNCLYHMLAQQISQDFKRVFPEPEKKAKRISAEKLIVTNRTEPKKKQQTVTSADILSTPIVNRQSAFFKPQIKSTPAKALINKKERLNTEIARKVTNTREALYAAAEKRYLKSNEILTKQDVRTLIGAYLFASKLDGRDTTYLENRPKYASKETGIDFKAVIQTGKYDNHAADIIKAEFVDILTRECWYNPLAFEYLQQHYNNKAVDLNKNNLFARCATKAKTDTTTPYQTPTLTT